MKAKIIARDKQQEIEIEQGQSVLRALQENGIYISAPCGGRGTCGKCRIKIRESGIHADANQQTADGSENGWQLACKTYLTSPAEIILDPDGSEEQQFQILSDSTATENQAEGEQKDRTPKGIAIDIGTTTIAMQLLAADNSVLETYTTINRQRVYGSDVISRIQAANQGHGEELRHLVSDDLIKGIQYLCRDLTVLPGCVVIAANTTMIHLLMGYSCETLGVYPFTPVTTEQIETDTRRLLGEECPQIAVRILPGISTYVGADIVSGIYACKIAESDRTALFLDLGTNGEAAIGGKGRVLVTSTAAGPAFEGGNISCGTGSIAGAVCAVEIHDKIPEVTTIGGHKPVGICGTGLVEAAAELVKEEILDEAGLLEPPYFDTGYPLAASPTGEILLTQKDIRELQLAKAAVRAGLETLIKRFETSCDEIDVCYIAGGFGYQLNVEKAIRIGLLPPQLREKIVPVGNSALNGAGKAIGDPLVMEKMRKIREIATEIGLSTDPVFNEYYVEAMFFEPELDEY